MKVGDRVIHGRFSPDSDTGELVEIYASGIARWAEVSPLSQRKSKIPASLGIFATKIRNQIDAMGDASNE